MSTNFRVEDLVGNVVRDANGREIGHIFDIVVEERGGELVIVEYHLGSSAFWRRIGISAGGIFGLKPKEPVRIPWERIDLSNPEKPVLTSP